MTILTYSDYIDKFCQCDKEPTAARQLLFYKIHYSVMCVLCIVCKVPVSVRHIFISGHQFRCPAVG